MKKRCSELVRFVSVLLLAVWALAPKASGQSRPGLGLRFSGGQPSLSLTGTVGTVYLIQHTTGLSPTNLWMDLTLVQAQGADDICTDRSAPVPGQRFYRAVSVSAPAGANLVFIQPGTFTMGSPTNEALRDTSEVQHTVTISRGFWLGKFLVTQADYLAVVGSNPSFFTSAKGYADDLTRPVEWVSWPDATNYCAKRTQQERAAGLIPANYVYRLPTESEWEYACRAGTTTAFYLGNSLHSGQANFDGKLEYDAQVGETYNSSGINLEITTPVGSYAANAWGLYDMMGNLFEWCQDLAGAYPVGTATDPQGAATGSARVIRGGDWSAMPRFCRSAFSNQFMPGNRSYSLGFRVLLTTVAL